jgi:hypothetical protein
VCVSSFFFTDDMQRDIRSHGMNKQTATTHAPGDFFLVEFFFCFVSSIGRQVIAFVHPVACSIINNQMLNSYFFFFFFFMSSLYLQKEILQTLAARC